MSKQQNKIVKLQPKIRQLKWGDRKVVPELRINGNWLSAHGFEAGTQVKITIRKNKLVIKPLR